MVINNNEILKRIQSIFDFSEQFMLSIFMLGGYEATKPELTAWLADNGKDEEPGSILCEDETLARFLNGLIIKNRGSKGDGIPEPENILSNNMVLRKLNIALNLQANDFLEILKSNDLILSKHELSALFRRVDHKNYRECSDHLLDNIFTAMAVHYR
jgi:uncharacterized protein YehS (DUF1456 family)